MLFDRIERSDRSPARPGESRFEFLNRSGTRYFARVRDLIEDWLGRVARNHRGDLEAALREDDEQHEAAFWELYLHEAYRRSGFEVEIHPELDDVPTRPDFRLTSPSGESFYLEAVTVGDDRAVVAERSRLAVVHRVLEEMEISDFILGMDVFSVGSDPLPTKPLRAVLRAWVGSLDPEDVSSALQSGTRRGFAALPSREWRHDGWHLRFHAFPVKPESRGLPRRALGMTGPGEAQVVDNATGFLGAVESKHGRYGELSSPLVVAVQSNTSFPTKDYEVERALYGLASRRPSDPKLRDAELLEPGFWRDRSGWRRGGTPQVISIYGLAPWTITKRVPRLWSTLESGVDQPKQPSWLARVEIAAEPTPRQALAATTHFQLDGSFWANDPDFDVR